MALKLTDTTEHPPGSPTSPGLPLCHGRCLGGPIPCHHVAAELSTLSPCRESRASRDPSGAKVSMALRWVFPCSLPLLFGIFPATAFTPSLPRSLCPQGEMGPPGLPGIQGPKVGRYVPAPER